MSYLCSLSVTKVHIFFWRYRPFPFSVRDDFPVHIGFFLTSFFLFFSFRTFRITPSVLKRPVRNSKSSLKCTFPTSKIDFGRVVLLHFAHFICLIFHFFGSESSSISKIWRKLTGKIGGPRPLDFWKFTFSGYFQPHPYLFVLICTILFVWILYFLFHSTQTHSHLFSSYYIMFIYHLQ